MDFGLLLLTVAVWVAWATVLLWLAGAALALRGIARQSPLAAARETEAENLKRSADAPLVSILVPARNEADRSLHESLASMLAQDYARFEIVAVNDRSTDATGEILRAGARADERLRVIEGKDTPDGWLGKPYALQQGLDAARGAWILATDADMLFAPEAVRTAVAYALKNNFDAVTLMPRVICLSFWERVFMPAFGWFMLTALPLENANDPRRKEAIGVGGFFLIKRAALEKIGGYEAVRAEVAEDLRTAEHLKQAGAKVRVEYAPDLAATRMQTNLPEIWEGFTKNLYAGVKFNLLQSVAGGVSVLLFSVAPVLVALGCLLAMKFFGADRSLLRLALPCTLVWLLQVLIFAVINRTWQIPVHYALTMPLGHALFIAILFNSTWRIATGRGVVWKGRTLYATDGVRPPR